MKASRVISKMDKESRPKYEKKSYKDFDHNVLTRRNSK